MADVTGAIRTVPTDLDVHQFPADTWVSTGLASDNQAIEYWLKERAGRSPHTFRRFSRCAKLLLAWMRIEGIESLSTLKTTAAASFATWLANPPAHLIALPTDRRNSSNHLFRSPMTQAQVRDTLSILNGMCTLLAGVEYLHRNPFAVTAHGKHATRSIREPRSLSVTAWQLFSQAARAEGPRARWFAAVSYHLLLRRSESARLTWSDFAPDPQVASGRGWRVFVLGKGNSEVWLPLTTLAVQEMTRWRLEIGKSPYPDVSETESIWASGKQFINKAPDPETLNRWAKRIAARAIQEVDRTADDARYLTEQLSRLTSHGIRHTRATHLLSSGASLADTQAALRHASIKNTGIYVATDRTRLRRELDRR